MSVKDVKLIVQPDAGIVPVVQAVRRAKKLVDICIFRFDRSELERELEAAVRRGVKVRALIAHTNRGGESRLRKLEQRLLAAGNHGRSDCGRSAALSRQVPDRRRHAARVRLQLHQAGHRQEPQLRDRHARPQDGARGVQAVRSRLHAPTVFTFPVESDRQPRDGAHAACPTSSAVRGAISPSTT